LTRRIDDERNRALMGWYASNGRDLPWRGVGNPYLVLVSETMLQQTQASRVVPFYTEFTERFPTVESLASAALDEVLAAWSGLGYNARAHRLREAARLIAKAGWPDTTAGLEALPGVGRYTAAAVASIAFDRQIAAIDTNLSRVLSRWNGEPLHGAALDAAAEAALGDPAGAWNQAVMDLGATLCLPRGARCHQCPAADWCSGPAGYVAPTPQARFEGSTRQLRGAIVRALVAAPRSVAALSRQTGFPVTAVTAAVDDLIAEGLLIDGDGNISIAD
jgi:A/G-specific adenine glycosylase